MQKLRRNSRLFLCKKKELQISSKLVQVLFISNYLNATFINHRAIVSIG
jgi:hypothetical protein